MSFNLQALKNAAREAGHVMAEAEHLIASEIRALETFVHFKFGMSARDLHYGMAYPATLPEGFPGKPGSETDAPAADESTPAPVAQAQVEAPAAAPIPEPTNEIVTDTASVPAPDVTAPETAGVPEFANQLPPSTEVPMSDATAAAQAEAEGTDAGAGAGEANDAPADAATEQTANDAPAATDAPAAEPAAE